MMHWSEAVSLQVGVKKLEEVREDEWVSLRVRLLERKTNNWMPMDDDADGPIGGNLYVFGGKRAEYARLSWRHESPKHYLYREPV